MDTRKEAEWILDKLTLKLRQELQAATQQREGNGAVEDAEKKEERHHDRNQAIKGIGRD
jgi:hypothetical protein